MRYLAMGDGLCAGVGASFLAPGFVQRHARLLENSLKERVQLTTIARASNRSKDILELLENSFVAEKVKESELIVLSAGQQDFLDAVKTYRVDGNEEGFQKTLKQCKHNIDDTIYKIKEIKANQSYTITLLGFHNPYHEDPLAEKWMRHFHKHIECRACSSHVQSVNLHQHFKGQEEKWCTKDFLYPNNEGHNEIANKLHELGAGNEIK
jgi:lysophospholipase L1-like esterase